MKKRMLVYVALCLSGSSNVWAMRGRGHLVPSMRACPDVYSQEEEKENTNDSGERKKNPCSKIPTSPQFVSISVPIDPDALLRKSPELQEQVNQSLERDTQVVLRQFEQMGVENPQSEAVAMTKKLTKFMLAQCSSFVRNRLSQMAAYNRATPAEKEKMESHCFQQMAQEMLKAGMNSFKKQVESGELSDTASSGSNSSDEVLSE